MKIKEQYVLKQIAGKHMVVPIKEEAINFNGIITLNETGAFLFDKLKQDTDIETLVEGLTNVYEIDRETAVKDIIYFIDIFKKKGLIET